MSAIKQLVLNRGIAPDSFLKTIVAWAKTAPDEIFAPNDNPADIYAVVKGSLGPWENDNRVIAAQIGVTEDKALPNHYRRAVMLEVMRVHAGFESSWNWNEGVDTTNRTSVANIAGQEAGIFQVSFDSTAIAHSSMLPFAGAHGIDTPQKFIPAMKADPMTGVLGEQPPVTHNLCLEYYARLVRVSVAWAGPIKRGEILPWLSRKAVTEFIILLS